MSIKKNLHQVVLFTRYGILNSETNRSSMTRHSLNILRVTFNGGVVEIHFRRVRPKDLLSHFSLPFIRWIFKDIAWRVTLAFELRKQLFMESPEYWRLQVSEMNVVF